MARPRFLSQFVASVIDNNTAATQFRIADNGVGVLRQPQIEVDELLNMDLFVPATNTTTGAGTFNQSLLDKANHREESGNYLLIVKTDNPCHIAVSNGLNYGDAWNQTSGVYNDLIKSTDAFVSGWGFLRSVGAGECWFCLPDYMSAAYASALLNGALVRFYKYTASSGLYTPISYILNDADMSYGYISASSLMQDNGAGDYYTAFQSVSFSTTTESVYPDASNLRAYANIHAWEADDRIAYSIEPINRIYGNLLVMKCDNPINLSIINTSADDVAGKVYLLKVIDELE